jgi:hypothetical protein
MTQRGKKQTNWQKARYWLYTMLGFRAFERRQLAKKILVALLQNPERYKYIAEQVQSGKVKQEEANNKNINKAYKIADSFVRWQHEA